MYYDLYDYSQGLFTLTLPIFFMNYCQELILKVRFLQMSFLWEIAVFLVVYILAAPAEKMAKQQVA